VQFQEKRTNTIKAADHRVYDFEREDWNATKIAAKKRISLFTNFERYMSCPGMKEFRESVSDDLQNNGLQYFQKIKAELKIDKPST